jgi:hypothetical protein
MWGNEVSTLSFWSVAVLISVVLLFLVGQISRFYAMFQEMRKEVEANMIGLSGQIKRQQSTLTEILLELRRANRLNVEMLDIKRAELTGDFEIVEEPVVQAEANASSSGEDPFPESAVKKSPLNAPPRQFPKINVE